MDGLVNLGDHQLEVQADEVLVHECAGALEEDAVASLLRHRYRNEPLRRRVDLNDVVVADILDLVADPHAGLLQR